MQVRAAVERCLTARAVGAVDRPRHDLAGRDQHRAFVSPAAVALLLMIRICCKLYIVLASSSWRLGG